MTARLTLERGFEQGWWWGGGVVVGCGVVVGWEELHVVWDRAGPLAVCDSAQVILYQLKGPAKSQGHCGFDESSCDLHALVTAVRLCNGKLIDQAATADGSKRAEHYCISSPKYQYQRLLRNGSG